MLLESIFEFFEIPRNKLNIQFWLRISIIINDCYTFIKRGIEKLETKTCEFKRLISLFF